MDSDSSVRRVHCPRDRPLSPDTARQAESALPATDQTARQTVTQQPSDCHCSCTRPQPLPRPSTLRKRAASGLTSRPSAQPRHSATSSQGDSPCESAVSASKQTARVITPQRPSDRTRPPWTPVRMAADPSAPVTCMSTARTSISAPLRCCQYPWPALRAAAQHSRPPGRGSASSLATGPSRTVPLVSESGTLPARACAVGADSSEHASGRLMPSCTAPAPVRAAEGQHPWQLGRRGQGHRPRG